MQTLSVPPSISIKQMLNRLEEDMRIALIFGLLIAGIADVAARSSPSSAVEVLINGVPVSRYHYKGTTYLEAIKGKEYEIRITNPIGARIAVALSVDGLNTIDARHTEARFGRKWVLEPYQSIVLKGWQINARQARRFFFTREERSYGAWLGQTENLGLISAAFFRERTRAVPQPVHGNSLDRSKEQARPDAAAAAELQSRKSEAKSGLSSGQSEYAATGIGDRIRYEVRTVYMDLEDQPFINLNMRYEFRPVLVKLGVIPPPITKDPLIRRENASGFREGTYCPEP
jgi:hypothetical protein